VKWIFLSLLIGNAVYFGWMYPSAITEDMPVTTNVAIVSDKSLTLLSELDTKPIAQPKKVVLPSVAFCETLGPVVDDLEVKHALARLSALGLVGRSRELILPGEPEYMVYHPSLPSRKLAINKLREFKVRKVDSYIITEGERKNALSLGRFKSKDLAYKHKAALNKKKIAAEIFVIESEIVERWIDVVLNDDFVLDSRTRTRIKANLNNVEWKKVECGDKR
jgi:hypothetical protein